MEDTKLQTDKNHKNIGKPYNAADARLRAVAPGYLVWGRDGRRDWRWAPSSPVVSSYKLPMPIVTIGLRLSFAVFAVHRLFIDRQADRQTDGIGLAKHSTMQLQ